MKRKRLIKAWVVFNADDSIKGIYPSFYDAESSFCEKPCCNQKLEPVCIMITLPARRKK